MSERIAYRYGDPRVKQCFDCQAETRVLSSRLLGMSTQAKPKDTWNGFIAQDPEILD